MDGSKQAGRILDSRRGAVRYGWILLILLIAVVIAAFLFIPAWWPWSS